jgi:hypothetical protein
MSACRLRAPLLVIDLNFAAALIDADTGAGIFAGA